MTSAWPDSREPQSAPRVVSVWSGVVMRKMRPGGRSSEQLVEDGRDVPAVVVQADVTGDDVVDADLQRDDVRLQGLELGQLAAHDVLAGLAAVGQVVHEAEAARRRVPWRPRAAPASCPAWERPCPCPRCRRRPASPAEGARHRRRFLDRSAGGDARRLGTGHRGRRLTRRRASGQGDDGEAGPGEEAFHCWSRSIASPAGSPRWRGLSRRNLSGRGYALASSGPPVSSPVRRPTQGRSNRPCHARCGAAPSSSDS